MPTGYCEVSSECDEYLRLQVVASYSIKITSSVRSCTVITVLHSNMYTGSRVQDRNPVVNQGPVEQKRIKKKSAIILKLEL